MGSVLARKSITAPSERERDTNWLKMFRNNARGCLNNNQHSVAWYNVILKRINLTK